jgi:hypothetical protein
MGSSDARQFPKTPRISAEQLRKAQQKLEQFLPKYKRLVEREKQVRAENQQLREEIEYFNRELIAREQEIELLHEETAALFEILHQMQQEYFRRPDFHARPPARQRVLLPDAASAETEPVARHPAVAEQDVLPLNIWLVSRDRFVEEIVSHYTHQRERLLIIENHHLVKRVIESGLFPDIIITGAYDFGLDDPFHQSLLQFLETCCRKAQTNFDAHQCLVLTLSSNAPPQPESLPQEPLYQYVRNEYISKFRGLQIASSEVRFFIELRRYQPDIMTADFQREIVTMKAAPSVMLDIQIHKQTGVLVIFSDDAPTSVRWAFFLWYLEGQLVKTTHTLESVESPADDVEALAEHVPTEVVRPAGLFDQAFTLDELDEQYQLNTPRMMAFFRLYPHTVQRKVQGTV